ncbi:glycosyl transferase [Pelomyxa schiedti]|nr:glycosyl transferase [Pelomyxa schiedti]
MPSFVVYVSATWWVLLCVARWQGQAGAVKMAPSSPSLADGFLLPEKMASVIGETRLRQLDGEVAGGRAISHLWEGSLRETNGANSSSSASCWLRGDAKRAAGELTIPRIIHQLNIQKSSASSIPPRLLPYVQTWKDLNPDWLYLLWDGDSLEEMVFRVYPELHNLYLSIETTIMRADAVRLLLLYAYGGIYADLDYELLVPLDSFLPRKSNHTESNVPASFGAVQTTVISNFFMFSATRSPVVGAMIDDFTNTFTTNRNSFTYHEKVLDTFGPKFVSRHASAHQDAICTFPTDMFNPLDYCGVFTGNPNPAAIHHYAMSWIDFTSLMNNLFKCHQDEAETITQVCTYLLFLLFVVGSLVLAFIFRRRSQQRSKTLTAPAQGFSAFNVVALSIAYTAISLLMCTLNRLFLLPYFQNAVPETYILFLAFSQVLTTSAFLGLFFLTKALDFKIEKWALLECVPCSLIFVGMIVSNFLSFRFLPATTIFLWKSLSSIITALGDWLIFRFPLTRGIFSSFLFMTLSCFFFNMNSTETPDWDPFIWIVLNTVLTSVYTLSYKHVIEKSSSIWTCTFIVNLFSAVVLLVMLTGFGTFLSSVKSTIDGFNLLHLCFIGNCIIAVLLCLCTVYLLHLTSPTTVCMMGEMASLAGEERVQVLDNQVAQGRALSGLWAATPAHNASAPAANLSSIASCWVPEQVGESRGARGDGGRLGVPRIIHQLSIQKDSSISIPPRLLPYVQTWKDLNPDWVYLLWDGGSLEEMIFRVFPELHGLYISIDTTIMRADAARLLILYAYGGIYADLDYELLIPLDSFLPRIINGSEWCTPPSFGTVRKTKVVSNFFMFSATRSPVVGAMIDDFTNTFTTNRNSFTYHEKVLDTFGPNFVSRHTLAHFNAVCTFPTDMFNPLDYCGVFTGNPNPAAIHHYDMSWIDFTSVMNNLFKCHQEEAEIITRISTCLLFLGFLAVSCALAIFIRRRNSLQSNTLCQDSTNLHLVIMSILYTALSLIMSTLNRVFLLPFFQSAVPDTYILFLGFSQVLMTSVFLGLFFLAKALEFRVQKWVLLECVPCSLIFVGMIVSNFLSFRDLPATTIFLWKSVSSIVTALGDWRIFRFPLTGNVFSSFLFMTLSCFFFNMNSPGTSDFHSFIWIVLNTVLTSAYILLYKHIIVKNPSLWSCTFIVNLFSALILFTLLLFCGAMQSSLESTIHGFDVLQLCFVGNCICSVVLCLCTAHLLRLASPTTLCMMGEFNKVAVSLTSKTTSFGGIMGALAKKRESDQGKRKATSLQI